MSVVKEPGFFLASWDECEEKLSAYEELFKGAIGQHVYVGEATTLYLSSRQALRNIHRFNPNARLIVLVRNPVELVQAFHSEMLATHCEDQVHFESAWRLREQRLRGECLPDYIQLQRHRDLLDYGRVGLLGSQLSHLLSIFPQEQVMPIVFDDFAADTATTMRLLLQWLGLRADIQTNLKVHNANSAFRFQRLAGVLRHPPGWVTKGGRLLKTMLGRDANMLGWLRRLNRKKTSRRQLNPEVERELKQFFREDVGLLSSLLERDLSYWLEPSN